MRVVLSIMGLFLAAVCAWGQGRELEAVRVLLERMAEDVAGEGNDNAMEGILEHYGRLLHKPVGINTATREELQRLHILSEFQVESLLEYRSNSGMILSATELQLVNGFHKEIVEALLPFIHFSTYGKHPALRRRGTTSSLLLKWWWKEGEHNHIGPPFHSQIKYGLDAGEAFSAGLTLEKDAGEKISGRGTLPLGDFTSFHIEGKEIPLGRNTTLLSIMAGDFTARLGQGAAVWNSLSINGSATVQNAFKRGAPIVPYTSTDENRFFRGGAATVRRRLGRFTDLDGTIFFSRKNVDARIRDGEYTSLPTDGLHNTESLLETRKTLGEIAYGGSIAIRKEKAKFGANYIGYGYNVLNGRKVQEYNRYQMYDGQYGNFSLDASAVLGKARAFAELAMDYGGNIAIICGLLARIAGWESAATLRSYSRSYIAPYAGAHSTTGTCSNQTGITISMQRQSGRLSHEAYLDCTHYPWTRFGTDGPSSSYKFWWRSSSSGEKGSWSLKAHNSGSFEEGMAKLGIKGTFGRIIYNWLELKLRGEWTTFRFSATGYAAAADIGIRLYGERLRLLLRSAYYNCMEWDCRLYMYENDLPQSYVSRLMYGKGFIWYALLQCRLGDKCAIHLKGDNTPKIKLGLKMRFF